MGRTSSVATSPPTPRTSPPAVSLTSPPRSSCSTTPDRCPTATLLCLTATQPTLPASSPRSWRRWTGVPASPPRTPPSSSSPVTPPSSSCSPASPCASSPSLSSLPLEGSLSGTCGRPLPSVSSRQPPPRKSLARLPRLQRRPTRRSEILFWGNLGTLNLPLYLACAWC